MRTSSIALSLVVAATTTYAADALARRPAAAVDEGIQLDATALAEDAAGSAAPLESAEAAGTFPMYCSTRTLRGTYQYREEGTWQGEPYRSSGLETYDGRGNVVGMATDSDTGESYRFTGTYEIDGDCHGRVRYSGDFFYDLYVAPDGSTIELIATDVGAVLSGPSRRVSDRFILPW
jgi:hypothetical protein